MSSPNPATGPHIGYLHDESFNPEWLVCLESAFENAAYRRAVPWLSKLMSKLPDNFITNLMPGIELFLQLRRTIHMEVERICYHKQPISEKREEKESTIQALRDSEVLTEEEKSLWRLKDEGQILIAAGSETTAKTLTETTFWVLHTPGVFEAIEGRIEKCDETPT